MCVLFVLWEPGVPILWSGNPYEVIMQKQIFKLSIQTAIKICVCQTIALKTMLHKSCFCLTYILYTKTCTSFWPYGTSRSGQSCPCNLFMAAPGATWGASFLSPARAAHVGDKRNLICRIVLRDCCKLITWNNKMSTG